MTIAFCACIALAWIAIVWTTVALDSVMRTRHANPRESGHATYKRVHWGETGKGKMTRSSAPSVEAGQLVELGRLVSVVYLTRKGGDTSETEYEHAFSARDMPILAFNRSGLFVLGGSYRITTRGIEG